VQNGQELRQIGHDKSKKTAWRKKRKNITFGKGRGINIVFGTKYRPLPLIPVFRVLVTLFL
jgi:hypothetical protein